MTYELFRPLLFRMDPERAHALTLSLLRLAGRLRPVAGLLSLAFRAPAQPVQAFGLTFPNPVGLAAGYDKDGVAIRGLAALGFGHIEVGTVTPLPQPGNPRPRIFRLVEDQAVINRMGFPSRGSEYVQMQLRPQLRTSAVEKLLGLPLRAAKARPAAAGRGGMILGVNLGRNKDTPNEQAVLDYVSLVDCFSRVADFLTINISSPNTPGLRQLQERAALESLLTQVGAQRALSEKANLRRTPVLVKLAPDLDEAELDEALEVILRTAMDGVIVTNTTLAREGLRSDRRGESGGLSGSPLRARSRAVLERTLERVREAVPVVSAGGIMNPDEAQKRLEMGAALVQVYTGLVYRGPGLVRDILRSLQAPGLSVF